MVVPPSMGGNSASNPPLAKATPTIRPSGTMPAAQPPTIPYSARRAAPLDMSTVERRGTQAAKDPPKRNRPHGLQEAPIYKPTEAEFRDPMEYIRKIAPEASRYGICKIIPPESWNPDFAIDLERFHFRTRRQELNSVEGGTRTNLNYLDQLAKFHKQCGTNLNRFPSVDKRPLDLYKLKKAVEVRGGFEKVCKDKKWAEIGRDLGYSGKIMSSLSTSLKNSYQRWLHPYEEYLRTVKPGVQQQLDVELGGHFSPSPALSPTKRFHSQSQPDGTISGSPAVQASIALHASMGQGEPLVQPTSPTPPPPAAPKIEAPRPVSLGFMAVNSGGFSAVNAPSSGFVAVNQAPLLLSRCDGEIGTGTPMPNGHGPTVPTGSSAGLMLAQEIPTSNTNGDVGSNPLKRTLSHESVNGESGSDVLNGDGDTANGRRSKRLKKDAAPTVAGSHMSLMRPSTPRIRSRTGNRKPGEKCEQCRKLEDKENIIVCDACELGYHKYCLEPPLATIPDYDWHCAKCLIGTGEYGFEEGGIYSLRHFQEKANNFKEHYFATRMPFDPVLNTRKKETEDDVEREFWKLVESLTETVEVEYGADIHSTTHGSGFPTVEKNPLDPYSKDPWNLNALPFHEESLFRHIKTDISGMTVPWLYVGMCFSTFCWHNEDHYTYSANYQHFGTTKTWYGIPGADAHVFEEAMRQAVPELFETQPDLLFQLVTLLPPDQLRKAGVNVYALDQRAGQFVVTFPQAYHAGFNHGFNFNEAVNFAPCDWEPFGEAGVQRLREFCRQPCFSHDELLLTAAAVDSSIKTAKWLAPALERMRSRELQNRHSFWAKHQEVHPHNCSLGQSDEHEKGDRCSFKLKIQDEELQEEEYQCQVCNAYTFLSQFYCHHSSKVYCLLHVEASDCCLETSEQKLQGSNHTLKLRFSDQRLSEIVQRVIDKARVPEAWQEKLDKLLEDGPRPSLKSLHSLLAEGKRIPVELSGLKDLAAFVKRCDQWLEEAEQYTTRKQQNRRKSEKTWKARSNKSMKSDEKELTVEGLRKLLTTAEMLSFSHEKIEQLEDKSKAVDDWRAEAKIMLRTLHAHSAVEIEELLEAGRSLSVTMQEIDQLDKQLVKTRWTEEAQEARTHKARYTLAQCEDLIKRGIENEIRQDGADMVCFQDMVSKGKLWESKTKQVMAQENVNYGQLEALWAESQKQDFPVNLTTLAELDAVLIKNRAAKEQIQKLYDRTKADDLRDRPTYEEVRNVMKSLEDWTSKPSGTVDLEREVKRHEDWMRKGKKLFGKANAPLHILKAHMEIVEQKNNYCFDLNDTFRAPVEPQSRDASPVDGLGRHGLGQDDKSVFCICRQPEGGMMIECEVCQDWYHGKCLKIARGKVQRSETFTCPICDWRVKIPRDAARPKLEDLQQWAEELSALPFQPDEEDILERIIDKAQNFRDFLQQFINGNQICRTSEEMPTILFYLRKIEGSEVLLAYETNIFRQDVHKWQPIAPEPPPILEQSLSTRKPRPTKQQKMMKELGVEKVEDLPPHMRKQQMVRRRTAEPHDGRPGPSPLQPAQMQRQGSGPNAPRSDTPLSMPRQASTGNAPNGPGFEGGLSFGHGFGNSASSSYQSPRHTTSPAMFSPTTSLPSNSGMRESMLGSGYPGGPVVSGPGADSSPALFSPGYGMGGDDDIRTGIVGVASNGIGLVHHNGSASGTEANGIVEGPEIPSSPHPTNVDEMFMEMTNEDPDGHDQHVNAQEARDDRAPTANVLGDASVMSSLPLPTMTLHHHPSEASEALAMIGDDEGRRDEASGANGASGGDEDGQGAFDEFLTGADV